MVRIFPEALMDFKVSSLSVILTLHLSALFHTSKVDFGHDINSCHNVFVIVSQ